MNAEHEFTIKELLSKVSRLEAIILSKDATIHDLDQEVNYLIQLI